MRLIWEGSLPVAGGVEWGATERGASGRVPASRTPVCSGKELCLDNRSPVFVMVAVLLVVAVAVVSGRQPMVLGFPQHRPSSCDFAFLLFGVGGGGRKVEDDI